MGPGGWGLAEKGRFVSRGRRVFSSSGPRPRQGACAHGGRKKTEKTHQGRAKGLLTRVEPFSMCQPYGIFPWGTDSVSLLKFPPPLSTICQEAPKPILTSTNDRGGEKPSIPSYEHAPGCREGNEEVGLGCSPLPGRGYLLPRELSPTEPCRRVASSHPSGEGCRGRYGGLRTTS